MSPIKSYIRNLCNIEGLNKLLCCKVKQLVDKLSSGVRGMSESYDNIAQMPFPVFTICPLYPYKNDKLAYHGVQGVREVQVNCWHSPSAACFHTGLFNLVEC